MGMLLRRHYVTENSSKTEDSPITDNVGMVENPEVEETETKYTEEQLLGMKSSEIKKLGNELGYKITAIKVEDCVKQFLKQQG